MPAPGAFVRFDKTSFLRSGNLVLLITPTPSFDVGFFRICAQSDIFVNFFVLMLDRRRRVQSILLPEGTSKVIFTDVP